MHGTTFPSPAYRDTPGIGKITKRTAPHVSGRVALHAACDPSNSKDVKRRQDLPGIATVSSDSHSWRCERPTAAITFGDICSALKHKRLFKSQTSILQRSHFMSIGSYLTWSGRSLMERLHKKFVEPCKCSKLLILRIHLSVLCIQHVV